MQGPTDSSTRPYRHPTLGGSDHRKSLPGRDAKVLGPQVGGQPALQVQVRPHRPVLRGGENREETGGYALGPFRQRSEQEQRGGRRASEWIPLGGVALEGRRAGRALTAEAGLPPADAHASPGTGCRVVGHRVAQAVSAVGAGAHVVAAVLQVGQRAHGAVAGLELGRRQDGAGLVRESGCGRRAAWSEAAAGDARAHPRVTGSGSKSPSPALPRCSSGKNKFSHVWESWRFFFRNQYTFLMA